jgi:hypothetical protein
MARKLSNWIQSYLVYTHESESPEEYHKWVAISAIAGAVRRKVFYDMGYFLIYPNMYIVLVGPAGRCKKSTAMRIGRGLLQEVPGLNFTTDSVTRERLIQDLSQSFVDGHSSMTAYSSEFASLLTSSGMDMVVFLTDIFDSPSEWSHRTKIGGTNKIKAPYLNLIGATTPDWISKAMPLDTVGIGLTSRIIFVYQDTPRVRPPRPKLTPGQMKLRELLVHDLTMMAQLQGEYKFDSPETEQAHDEWYQARTLNPNPTGDHRLDGFYERKPVHVIKLAMLIAASFRDELIITNDDFQLALGIFEQAEERMLKVFANVGKNPLALDYDMICAAIAKSENGLSLAELMTSFQHSVRKDELNEVLETLVLSEKIDPTGNRRFKIRRDKK